MMMLGGWALIVPGLITDLLGAALLVPAMRRVIMPGLRNLIRAWLL